MIYKVSRVFVLLLICTQGMTYAQKYDFVVANDGSGTYRTVQEAINAVPDFRKAITTIFIKNGVYKEKLTLPTSKSFVTLVGESVEKTLITYDDYASKKNLFGEEIGTTGSSGFFVFGNDFTAKNITFENSSGPVGQAVAVRVDGDRVYFENCRFIASQDTLYPHGANSRQYYKNCYIEGTTDFIFGWSTAVFEDCKIFSKQGGSYITAASTQENTAYGFVFIRCQLTSDAPDHSVYLGRPWRSYAQTVFINCELGAHIKKEGWHNWNKPEAEKTSFYAEYGSKGRGAKDLAERVTWSHQLSPTDLDHYELSTIFDGWKPQ